MATALNDTTERSPSRKRIDAAKKYWWAPAIAVPVAVALIQVLPALVGGGAPAGATIINNSRIGSDLYFVTNVQIEDPVARARFDQAIALAQAGQYAEAKAVFEQMAPASKSAAVYNNLAVVNAALDDDTAALKNVQHALQLEPMNEAVQQNLSLLARVVREQTANNSIRTPAPMEIGTAVRSRLASEEDADFFSFTTPAGPRDLFRVAVENQSTTFAPQIRLFNSDRAEFAFKYIATLGADLSTEFVARPGATYYVQVTGSGESGGSYAVSVTPRKAFDGFEPNDDILTPSAIAVGREIQAGIMDEADADFYQFSVAPGPVRAVLTNRSATLGPGVRLFDSDKREVTFAYNTTAGGNTRAEAAVEVPGTWYASVASATGAAGEYALTIEQ